MTIDIAKEVCFVGLGTSAVAYYRAMLPAMSLGCDWSGVAGDPPELQYLTGLRRKDSQVVDPFEYKVVIVQQPYKESWLEYIPKLQEKGIKVVYEVDDYLHGIEKVKSHDFRSAFTRKLLDLHEQAMTLCDATIVSTSFIAKRYAKYGPVYVCKNGIDPARYDLEIPKRETVNIGWAGATGHTEAIKPWMQKVYEVMLMREKTTFISVGQNYAGAISHALQDESRAISVPWCQIEQYPSAMTMFDIAIAPAGPGSFFRGKSDLRWLEAGALGIPIIADPRVYDEIESGWTGFHADNPMGMAASLVRLIEDEELRTTVGRNAKEYILENRAFPKAADQWADVIEQVIA